MSGYNLKKKKFILLSEDLFLPFTDSEDSDEMQHYAAFHLGLHCVQKYWFSSFPNTKGSSSLLQQYII